MKYWDFYVDGPISDEVRWSTPAGQECDWVCAWRDFVRNSDSCSELELISDIHWQAGDYFAVGV